MTLQLAMYVLFVPNHLNDVSFTHVQSKVYRPYFTHQKFNASKFVDQTGVAFLDAALEYNFVDISMCVYPRFR